MSYNYLIQLKKLRPHVGLLIKVLRADARACGHNKYHIIIVSTAYQQVLWYTVAESIPNATRYSTGTRWIVNARALWGRARQ